MKRNTFCTMKKRIFSLLLLVCSIITGTATAQESGDKERFFPANSIRCTNVITVNFAEMDQTVPKETIYYEMWTGNDTIVDGKPCVTLWQQFDRSPFSRFCNSLKKIPVRIFQLRV